MPSKIRLEKKLFAAFFVCVYFRVFAILCSERKGSEAHWIPASDCQRRFQAEKCVRR